jgi:hypothetical protein
MKNLMKMLAAGAAFAALAAIVCTVQTASAQAATRCPGDGTPPPGSTIYGGLEITGGVEPGYCELHDVTVYGGIVVDPTPDAFLAQFEWNVVNLIGSTVSGGVVVGRNSEASSNIICDSGCNIQPQPTTISGGLRLNNAIQGFVLNATISGAVTVNGNADLTPLCDPAFCWANHVWCDVTVDGNVSLTDINGNQDFLGDPEEQLFSNGVCRGNTIHGSVFMRDSNFVRPTDGEPTEIEGNTITGSVYLDHSTLELGGNTIGGSLLCTNGTVIHPAPPHDVAGNTVRGRDTCD